MKLISIPLIGLLYLQSTYATNCVDTDGTDTTAANCGGSTHGACTNGAASGDAISCVCTAMWSGDDCMTAISACPTTPCSGGGVCTAGITAVAYVEEVTAVTADPDADPPIEAVEAVTEVVEVIGTVHTCACDPYNTGTNCETPTQTCPTTTPCNSNGACTDGATAEDSFVCVCTAGEGWNVAAACATCYSPFWVANSAADGCDVVTACPTSDACSGFGTCTAGATTADPFTCACNTGYEGDNCETVSGAATLGFLFSLMAVYFLV